MVDDSRAEYNNWWSWANWEGLIPSVQDTTFYIGQSGTDTDTSKYLTKKQELIASNGARGTGFVLRTDKTIQLVQINETVFDIPITISTAGMTITKHCPEICKLVVRTTITDTSLKLLVT